MTDLSVITRILRPLKLVMAQRSKYVDATYYEDILPNSYVGYPTHLVISNRMCVRSRTLKRISYKIYFGLRMYVDSRTRVATQNLMASSVRCQGTHTSVSRIFTRSTHRISSLFLSLTKLITFLQNLYHFLDCFHTRKLVLYPKLPTRSGQQRRQRRHQMQ